MPSILILYFFKCKTIIMFSLLYFVSECPSLHHRIKEGVKVKSVMQTQHFERHPILYATMLRSFYKLQHYFGTVGMCIYRQPISPRA